MNTAEILSKSKERYFARIGCLMLLRQEPNFAGFRDEMINCLKDSPIVPEAPSRGDQNINDVLRVTDATAGSGVLAVPPATESRPFVDFEYGQKLGEKLLSGHAPVYEDALEFEAIWPAKNQFVPDWYDGPVLERFRILYDGASFVTLSPIEDPPGRSYLWTFGREAMRILDTVFSTCEAWQVGTIGPTPIYPGFHFVFVDETDLPTELTAKIDRDVWIVLPDRTRERNLAATTAAMDSIRSAVICHYETVAARSRFFDASGDLTTAISELGETHREILTQNSWLPTNYLRRLRQLRSIRLTLNDAYHAYIRTIEARSNVDQWQKLADSQFNQSPFLAPVSDYTSETVEDVFAMDEAHQLQALRFFEEESRSMGLQTATVQSAIAWALIGLVAVWILSELF